MDDEVRIRPAIAGDEDAVTHLAVVTGMFGRDEVGDLAAVLTAVLSGELPEHRWWVVESAGSVVAAAYLAPEPFADRLWNLYFIAVSPTAQAGGVGTRLIHHVEQQLRAAGEQTARVLLVETSSTEQYAGARRFYRARDFTEEARIREFYGPGDHKVVFWKALTD